MPASVPYVHGDLVMDHDGYWLKCECGAPMWPQWGKRTDGEVEKDFVWHMCSSEPEHITEEIEISPEFRDTFIVNR